MNMPRTSGPRYLAVIGYVHSALGISNDVLQESVKPIIERMFQTASGCTAVLMGASEEEAYPFANALYEVLGLNLYYPFEAFNHTMPVTSQMATLITDVATVSTGEQVVIVVIHPNLAVKLTQMFCHRALHEEVSCPDIHPGQGVLIDCETSEIKPL